MSNFFVIFSSYFFFEKRGILSGRMKFNVGTKEMAKLTKRRRLSSRVNDTDRRTALATSVRNRYCSAQEALLQII